MDHRHFVRNSEHVIGTIKEVGDTLVTLKGCKIYIPCAYEAYKLLNITGSEYLCTGIFPIVLDNNHYGVMKVNIKIKLLPEEIRKVQFEDGEYYELVFSPGAVITDNINCVQDDVLTYFIYNYFIGRAYVPWFFTYDDLAGLFDTAEEYAGSASGKNPEVISLLVAIVSRVPNDRTMHYRHQLPKTKSEMSPAVIPINSVEYGATNTFNKLAGNYFDIGVASALLNPTTRVEPIEALIRA